MHRPIARASGAFLALILLISSFPLPADAQSRSSDRNRTWRDSRESASESSSRTSSNDRRGLSSSIRKKIDKLDDDAVEKLPIPILMGFTTAQLTRNFGDPRDGGARSHEGLDLMAPKGAYIVSPTDAVVLRTGSGSSAGKYVYTANPGSETFAYMHLDDFADGIKAGTELKAGDLIGYVGNTGNAAATAPHLHFEIREGRQATDPYPRLTREFTLKQRIAALEEIVADADDEEEEAEDIAKAYRGTLVGAVAAGIELSDDLADALGTVPAGGTVIVGDGVLFTRDLTLGSQGSDVTALQNFLVAQKSGAKATALAEAGTTGYFGAVTQAALAEYQAKAGISPASGYFGTLTRARILAAI